MRAYGEWEALGVAVGGILVVQHVVQVRDLAIAVCDLVYSSRMSGRLRSGELITYDRELDISWGGLSTVLVDILDPLGVLV